MNEDVLDRDEKAPGNSGTDFRDKKGLRRDEMHDKPHQEDIGLDLKPPYAVTESKDIEPIS